MTSSDGEGEGQERGRGRRGGGAGEGEGQERGRGGRILQMLQLYNTMFAYKICELVRQREWHHFTHTPHTHAHTHFPLPPPPHCFFVVLWVQEVNKLLVIHTSIMVDVSVLEALLVTCKCGLQSQLHL